MCLRGQLLGPDLGARDPHAEVHPPGPDHGDREDRSQSATHATGGPGHRDREAKGRGMPRSSTALMLNNNVWILDSIC